jgi:hypothetical protein
MFAVLFDDSACVASGSILAMFVDENEATKWGHENYSRRFKVVEVRLGSND